MNSRTPSIAILLLSITAGACLSAQRVSEADVVASFCPAELRTDVDGRPIECESAWEAVDLDRTGRRDYIYAYKAGKLQPAVEAVYAEEFTRWPEMPNVFAESFSISESSAIIRIVNDEADPVTSADVKLNGRVIFRPDDFKDRPRVLTARVAVAPQNDLEVTLHSAPNTSFWILVEPKQ